MNISEILNQDIWVAVDLEFIVARDVDTVAFSVPAEWSSENGWQVIISLADLDLTDEEQEMFWSELYEIPGPVVGFEQ